jgi:formamidopyrimidine-DNA glycosylase
MPELPEVETVRRSLELHLQDEVIHAVGGRSVRMRRPLSIEDLSRRLPGRRLVAFRRRGKFLLLDLEPEGSLLIHLGMSGQFLLEEASQEPKAHTHLRLTLGGGRELRFRDPRRFGFAHYLSPGDESRDPSLNRLGIEPLADDLEISLPPRMKSRRAPVKSVLLDQKVVAGIGNIYAAEALWRAGVHPVRPASRISTARLRTLAGHVRDVLQEAIEQGGTTLRDYVTPEGSAGYFAVRLQVYGRAGKPCNRCGEILRDRVLAGRSTVYCSACQR